MKRTVNFNTQATFDNQYQNDKFMKLRLRVVNVGENPNASHFSREAIDKAEMSLLNTPILANITVDEETGEINAGGHDYDIIDDGKGDFRAIYKEQIIGIVPESNNYTVEEFNGQEYVYVDGYIHKDYSNYAQDFVEQNDELNISMEIAVNDAQDFEGSDGVVDITDFYYKGITVLNTESSTGIEDARAFKEFSLDDDCKTRIDEISKDLVFEMEAAEVVTTSEPVVTEVGEPEEVDLSDYEIRFVLSHDDVRAKIYRKLEMMDSDLSGEYVYLVQVYDTFYIYEQSGRFYKQEYQVTEEDVKIEFGTAEVFAEFLTESEINQLATLREVNKQLNADIFELQQYKLAKEEEEAQLTQAEFVQSKLDYIEENFNYLPEEAYELFKTEIDKYESIEDLEVALALYVVRNKVKAFSLKEDKEKKIKKPFAGTNDTKVSRYGPFGPTN